MRHRNKGGQNNEEMDNRSADGTLDDSWIQQEKSGQNRRDRIQKDEQQNRVRPSGHAGNPLQLKHKSLFYRQYGEGEKHYVR